MSTRKQAAAKRITRLKSRLEKYPLFRFLKRLAVEWKADDANDRAAAIAYHGFMSIFPLLLGTVALLGFFLPNAEVRQAVSDALTRALPGSAEFMGNVLDDVIELRGLGGVIGILALLWSGSNMFAAISRGLNRAWGITQERGFLAAKTRDLALVVGTGFLFLLSMAASAAFSFLDEADRPALSTLVVFGSQILGFLLGLLVFIIIHKFVPNTRTVWRWIWPGALLSAVLFQAGIYIFIFYLTNFANYESVYGPIGSVIILLMWIYLSSMILILGAEVNSELQRRATVSDTNEITRGEPE